MANDILIQPEAETENEAPSSGLGLDPKFGVALEEKSTWAGLYESLCEVFFPLKLPPLELTSTPIPVPDRMKVKANPWAIGIATGVNVAIVAVMLFLGVRKIIDAVQKPPVTVTDVDLNDVKLPSASVAAGGGGGSPDKIEAVKGRTPPRMQTLAPTPKIVQPPLPSVDVQKEIIIPDNPAMPNFGVSNSPNVKIASSGMGSGVGLGNGVGSGLGNGSGGNFGGGVYQVGGVDIKPVLLHSLDAEFSEEARRNKYQGIVLVSIIIDAQGNPQNPRVVRPLGMGLDEEAVKAVLQYKFRPAMKNGKPVAVHMNVEIDFRLY